MVSGIKMAVTMLKGCWPQSQECNGLLHYDWRTGGYLSDFYGHNEYVLLICTKDEFIKARQEK